MNPTEFLKILKTTNSIECRISYGSYILDKHTFSSMQNLRKLDLGMFRDTFSFQLCNDSFIGLSNLQELNIGQCVLNISDSGVFSNLINLKKLSFDIVSKLNRNVFKGLSNLVELDISQRRIDKLVSINFRHLASLQKLRIEVSKIRPSYFKGLTNLKELSIYIEHKDFNKFEAISLEKIEANAFLGLDNLEKLNLPYNGIKILRSHSFKGLNNLKELNLAGSSIKQLEKYAFSGLSNLETLYLNSLKVQILKKELFQDLKNLKNICLTEFSSTKIEENPFIHLVNLENVDLKGEVFQTNLAEMIFSNCYKKINKLTIKSEEYYKQIENIKYFGLNNLTELTIDQLFSTYSSGDLPPKIKFNQNFFKELKALKKLKFYSNEWLEFDSNSFGNLTELQYLNLGAGYLSFTGNLQFLLKYSDKLDCLELKSKHHLEINSKYFCNLKNLRHLTLRNILLNKKSFENLSNLQTLDLCHCSQNKEFYSNEMTFFGLTSLKELKLNCSKMGFLNDKLLKPLINLTNLDLSECNISSIHMYAFKDLTKLEEIDLSENKIDCIDEQLFKDLINLKKLDLNRNPFIYKTDIFNLFQNLNLNQLDLIVDASNYFPVFPYI